MGARCQVCAHPRVRVIHDVLLTGESFRGVGRRFGLDRDAVRRHFHTHMSGVLPEAVVVAPLDTGLPAGIDRHGLLGALVARTFALVDRLEDDLDAGGRTKPRDLIAVLSEVRQSLTSLVRLSTLVEDRPAPPAASERPDLDEATMQALVARDFPFRPARRASSQHNHNASLRHSQSG
jgi:hypothetical protein